MMRTVGRVLQGLRAWVTGTVGPGGLGLGFPTLASSGLAILGLASLGLVMGCGSAAADQPKPWQIGLQDPASPVADYLYWFHNDLLLVIITAITLLVMLLLLYVIIRFRASANPVPSKTSHNTTVEILWTVLPIAILVVIAIPSFNLLYFQEDIPKSDLTLKVTGIQWYWHYAYPDNGNFAFDSNLIDEQDLQPGQKRLLDVDNEVVLPADTTIRVQIAGQDVMHSWFVPSLAAQKYAVPGHLNELWIKIERPGIYYGECNQICGVNHAFMPIKIHAVPRPEFDAWVLQAQKKFARADPPQPATTELASAR